MRVWDLRSRRSTSCEMPTFVFDWFSSNFVFLNAYCPVLPDSSESFPHQKNIVLTVAIRLLATLTFWFWTLDNIHQPLSASLQFIVISCLSRWQLSHDKHCAFIILDEQIVNIRLIVGDIELANVKQGSIFFQSRRLFAQKVPVTVQVKFLRNRCILNWNIVIGHISLGRWPNHMWLWVLRV